MDIRFFCPRWGSEAIPWDVFFQKVRRAGYDGVEYAIGDSVSVTEISEICNLAEKQGVLLIFQHYDTTDSDFYRHLRAYEKWLKKIQGFHPYRVNSQTGKDFFSFEQNIGLLSLAKEYSVRSGIPLSHETHRGKFSFAAHVTQLYLESISDLRITLDTSHWVSVAESYLEDQPRALQQAISRTDHIHARVGHSQGPQVPDPRAPEWKQALNIHLGWWDSVIDCKKLMPGEKLAITPEFGPSPYMPTIPYSAKPMSDQWELNEYMLNLLKQRYQP